MKKLFSILLALTLGLATLAVFAESPIPSPDAGSILPDGFDNEVVLTGFVLEVTDAYLLVRSDDGMTVQVNLADETVIDGDIAVGDHIHVVYNGMMTRSMPAQITAAYISCFKLEGIVSEKAEAGFLLTVGEQSYQVNATEAQLANIQDGMSVTVYFDGKMTRSMPGQVNASHVRGQGITGTVTEMTQEGFTLSMEDSDIIYTVIPKADALIFVTPEPGLALTIITDGVMTMSLDPIVNAVELLPAPVVQELHDLAGVITEMTEEYLLITGADGQEYQVNLLPETHFEGKELAIGDLIHVTHNDQMTFSLPAQVAALSIGCYTHQGVVSELNEEACILTTETDTLLVHLTADQAAAMQNGETVIIYTNGVMTMSLPAQVTAEMVVTLTK